MDTNKKNIVNTPEFTQQAWLLFNDIRKKDASTAGHCLRVAEFTEAYAKNQGYDDNRVQELFYSALLHDAGKIKIDDNILNSTKKYTPEERKIMNSHSEYGLDTLTGVLKDCDFLKNGMEHHHSSYNPDPELGGMLGGHVTSLRGKDIPEEARIIAVADVYDALSHARAYKNEISEERVFEMINDDPRLDPDIKDTFIPFIKEYMAEKQAVEEIQAQTIVFETKEDVNKDRSSHLLDDRIGNELKKQIDKFVNIKDKTPYVSPSKEEIAIMQWNTAMREIIKGMPIAHDQSGNKYDPIPICDFNGKIHKINYYSEAQGIKIGSYNITSEDAEKTAKGISDGVINLYFGDKVKTNEINANNEDIDR